MSELLRDILKKKYPLFERTKNLSIDDILDWVLWPKFMKIFCKLLPSFHSFNLICSKPKIKW